MRDINLRFFNNLLLRFNLNEDTVKWCEFFSFFFQKYHHSHLLILSSLKLKPPQLRHFVIIIYSIRKRTTSPAIQSGIRLFFSGALKGGNSITHAKKHKKEQKVLNSQKQNTLVHINCISSTNLYPAPLL